MCDVELSFFKSTKKNMYEAKQQKKSIRNKRIKRIKIVSNIEDIRLKRLIEKQSELHQYRVKGVKIGAVLPLQAFGARPCVQLKACNPTGGNPVK